ncbi:hypothetical protein ASPCAL06277 [Aspergillus calidoustus]|uniref:Uncharacterized protein n=1 Tax=Aspergillus calidoustus TaxID=454130 RepID=A0A0U4Z5V5_ASPCI|nr:hypothetical protein ASPCAL06277 [Aspergillus calidoustus]
MQATDATRRDNGDQGFSGQETHRHRSWVFPFELEQRVRRWMMNENIAHNLIGNLQPVWEIITSPRLHELDELETYLTRIRFDEQGHAERFAPLPVTVATYLIEVMLGGSWVQTSLEKDMEVKGPEELQRYKIRTVRDTFLWLGDLVDAPGTWAWMLLPPSDVAKEREIRKSLKWLQHEDTKRFYRKASPKTTLNAEDLANLEGLWRMFEEKKDKHRAIRYAFFLARLEAMGSWGEKGKWESQGWPKYYNQVIKGLF